MRTLIIGYGNPSRQDDGVGHYVVNRLNRRWGLPEMGPLGEPPDDNSDTVTLGADTVRTVWVQQLDLDLAEEAASVDQVLFIDAHLDGPLVAEVAIQPALHVGVTTHVVTPDTLVHLAGALFGHAPRAVRHSLRGTRFNFGVDLAPDLAARADELADRIAALLES